MPERVDAQGSVRALPEARRSAQDSENYYLYYTPKYLARSTTKAATPPTFSASGTPASATAPTTDTPCRRCGAIDAALIGHGNGPHAFRASCRHCGGFLRWVSRYMPAERQARREQGRQQAMAQKPPSQAQLDYLKTLGDTGAVPSSMAEASKRIDAMVPREARV